ncbi:helix-turn-helix transcriptional regulator [Streptomyces sp. S465]|uniref:helix-turn-helix transcriptional regulator n=1 Tax=Streptomyces sp. S465 TaxID=2979468 RepID=UPI0022A83A57|nr:helix-turn-helix transcriptional regulator [Streptomyces sp. S465]WAP56094.1 AAA family ATPase [Streptomyces sp. S465]
MNSLPANLFECENHLSALRDMLRGATQGRGRLALVSGAVASGKTTLLNTFAEHAIDQGALLLEAAGSRAESDLPFGILRKIFDNAAMPADVRSEAIALLDGNAPESTAAGRMHVMSQITSVLLRMVDDRTLVVLVDDVHCGDGQSLEFLLHLARRVRQAKVLIVLTESPRLRQEQFTFHAELLRQPNCVRMRLHMLTEAGVAEALSGSLSATVAARLAPECHRVSGGNPLLLRALLEDWRTVGEHGEAQQRPVPGEAFAHAVLGCLHRGEPEALRIARGIAVLGDARSPRLLGQLLDLSVNTVHQGIQDLHQCGLLEHNAFRDEVARTAVLDAIPATARSTLHARAARLLHTDGASALDVARQLVSARQDAEAWTVPVLREAAEFALVEEELEFALRCLEYAHHACEPGPERTALKARLVGVAWRIGPAAAESHLPELIEGARKGRLAPRDVAPTTSYLAWSGRLDAAADAVCALARSARAGDDDPAMTAAVSASAQWLTMLSPPLRDRLPTVGTGSPAATGAPRDMAGLAYAHAAATMSAALTEGQVDRAVIEAERVLQRYHLSDSTLQPLVVALLALVLAGRLDLALSWCERLLGECSARRVPTWQALLSAVRAEIALRQGDLQVAAHQARTAMSRISVQGWGVGLGLLLSTLIQAETGMGHYDEAMALLEQPLPDELFQTLPGLFYLRARGRCHLATGRYHAALGDFTAAGELMDTWRMDMPLLSPWRLDAAETWLALGDPGRARALAEEQLRRGPDDARLRGALLVVLARTDELKRRVPRLKEAVEILEGGDDRVQLAIALGELGRAYRSLGDFNRGRVFVRKAWHVAKTCGADPLCRELMPRHADSGEFAAAAAQPGQGSEAQRDVEALTEAEVRIAVLAAHGNTNREIASKLYVTVSTVEQHLTRIYRKLNVKRRRDLPAKLSDSSLTGTV